MRRTHIDHVDIGNHLRVIAVDLYRGSELRFQLLLVQFTSRTDRCHTRALDILERLDVGARYPSHPDNPDLHITHKVLLDVNLRSKCAQIGPINVARERSSVKPK